MRDDGMLLVANPGGSPISVPESKAEEWLKKQQKTMKMPSEVQSQNVKNNREEGNRKQRDDFTNDDCEEFEDDDFGNEDF